MRIFAALCLAFVLLACGPIVMIPGGKLSGTDQPVPGDWSFTDAVDTVQLETNPGDPYSVNIWGIGAGDVFYVGGSKESTWVQNILADPNVRLRVEDDLYDLRATPTDSDADIETFLAGVEKKYDRSVDREDREGAQVFRLTPR